MKQLSDLAQDQEKRTAVVNDCTQLVHDEVRSKKGLGGIAVKAAFKVVNALKPGMIQDSVHHLLDDFIAQLQPYFEGYQNAGSAGTMSSYLGSRGDQVAESLLSITDARARGATNKTLVKAYNSLRPKGKAHVQAAAPGIGRVLDKHIGGL